MRVQCPNCNYNRSIAHEEVNKILMKGKFQCLSCKQILALLERKNHPTLALVFFDSEEEVRSFLIKIMKLQNIKVWDCRGEAGLCIEPVRLSNIDLVLKTGDFPFFYNGRHYLVELKFIKYRCKEKRASGKHWIGRIAIPIDKAQNDAILQGAGFLVVVSEPLSTAVGLGVIVGENPEDCRQRLFSELRLPLARSKVPYEVWVLDQELYKRLDESILRNKEWIRIKRRKKDRLRKNIPFTVLNEIIPESKHLLTICEIQKGAIATTILQMIGSKSC